MNIPTYLVVHGRRLLPIVFRSDHKTLFIRSDRILSVESDVNDHGSIITLIDAEREPSGFVKHITYIAEEMPDEIIEAMRKIHQ